MRKANISNFKLFLMKVVKEDDKPIEKYEDLEKNQQRLTGARLIQKHMEVVSNMNVARMSRPHFQFKMESEHENQEKLENK